MAAPNVLSQLNKAWNGINSSIDNSQKFQGALKKIESAYNQAYVADSNTAGASIDITQLGKVEDGLKKALASITNASTVVNTLRATISTMSQADIAALNAAAHTDIVSDLANMETYVRERTPSINSSLSLVGNLRTKASVKPVTVSSTAAPVKTGRMGVRTAGASGDVIRSFDPAIAAAAKAPVLTDLEMQQDTMLQDYVSNMASMPTVAPPKPAAPPPAPPPEPARVGAKFVPMSREEAMASTAKPAPKPRGKKAAAPPAQPPPPPPPTSMPPGEAPDDGGDGDEPTDTSASAVSRALTSDYGPYKAGFDPEAEYRKLRRAYVRLGPRIGTVIAHGGYESDTEQKRLALAGHVITQRINTLSATFPEDSSFSHLATRITAQNKLLSGSYSNLKSGAAFTRFKGLDERYQALLNQENATPEELRDFTQQITAERIGVVNDPNVDPGTRTQLLRQLQVLESGAQHMVFTGGFQAGAYGGALAGAMPGPRMVDTGDARYGYEGHGILEDHMAPRGYAQDKYETDENGFQKLTRFGALSPTAARITRGGRDRTTDIGAASITPGTISAQTRQGLREELEAEDRLLQKEQQRLKVREDMLRAQGQLTRGLKGQLDTAQAELGQMREQNQVEQQRLQTTQTSGGFRAGFLNVTRGYTPDLATALRNYADDPTAGRGRGFAGGLSNLMQTGGLNPVNIVKGVTGGIGGAIGSAVGGGPTSAAARLGETLGSGAGQPIIGMGLLAAGMVLSRLGEASQQGTAIESLYRRGGYAGTGQTNVGNTGPGGLFKGGLYEPILNAGAGLGFSRDESIQMAQMLASGGMSRDNQLNSERMKSALGFSRFMGVDTGETGQFLSGIQRIREDTRGNVGQDRILGILAQSISQGGMRGRESEVLEGINRLTQTMAARGVSGDPARMAAMETIFNRSGDPLLRGALGTNALQRIDQGIQGSQGYNQAFLYNAYARQAAARGETYDPLRFIARDQPAGLQSEFAPGAIQEMITRATGVTSGNLNEHQQDQAAMSLSAGLGIDPALARRIAALGPGGITAENIKRVQSGLQQGGVEGAANALGQNVMGINTQPVGQLGSMEALNDAFNGLNNEMTDAAANVAGVTGKIIELGHALAALVEHATAIINMTGNALGGVGERPGNNGRNGNDPAADALSWLGDRLGVGRGSPSPNAPVNGGSSSSVYRAGTGGSSASRVTGAGAHGAPRTGAPGMGAANPMSVVRQTIGAGTPGGSWTCGPSTAATIVNGMLGTNMSEAQATQLMTSRFGQSQGGDMPWSALPAFVSYVSQHAEDYGGQSDPSVEARTITADDAIDRLNQGQAVAFSQNTMSTSPGGVHGPNYGHIMGAQGMGNGQFRLLDPNKREGAEDIVVNEDQLRNLMNRQLQGQPSQIWGFNGGRGPGSEVSDYINGLTGAGGQRTPISTMGGRTAFMQTAYSAARAQGMSHEEAVMATALAGTESNFGNYDSFFGTKTNDPNVEAVPTEEVIGGVRQTVMARFVPHHTFEEGMAAFPEAMTANSAWTDAYQAFHSGQIDADEFTRRLRAPGGNPNSPNAYATEIPERFYNLQRSVRDQVEQAVGPNGTAVIPQSYVDNPMTGESAQAARDVMALNVKFDNPTVTIQLPDGTVVGQAQITPMQDLVGLTNNNLYGSSTAGG